MDNIASQSLLNFDMNTKAYISEYFVEGTNREVSHVLLHITEPSTAKEHQKGAFFALCEVNHGDLAYIKEVQKMIETIEEAFYASTESFTIALEQGIELANKRSHHLLKTDKKETSLHCFVGALHGNDLAFAFHGNIQAHVVYHNKDDKLKLLDIVADAPPESEHVFASIVEGALNLGDYLHISTNPVSKIVDHDRIPFIFQDKDPNQISEYLGSTIEKTVAPQSFGGIVFQVIEEEETEELEKPRKKKPILGLPKKKPTEEPKATKVLQNAPETNYRPRPNTPSIPMHQRVLTDVGRALVQFFGALGKTFWGFFKMIGKWTVYAFFLATNKGGQRQATKDQIKNDWRNLLSKFTSLPLTSKILLCITIVLACVFVGSVLYMQNKEAQQAFETQKNNTLLSIEDKLQAAEAKMVYDEESAFTLVKEAQSMIEQAKVTYGELVQLSQSASQAQDLLGDLQKLEETKAEILVDLNADPENSLESLALIGDDVLVFDKDTPSTYRISTLTKKKEKIENQSLDRIVKANTPKEEDATVLLRSDSTIGIYDTEVESIKAADIEHTNEDTQLSDVFVYNTRLYAVSPNDKQIYRYSKTTSGYGKGTAWLTGGIKLADGALSLTIDGDIFVSSADGSIAKYAKGAKEPFDITGLDPKLESPVKIWTYNDVNQLFILDPPQKRIVILDKNGKLLKQLTASNFNDLKDFAVQPEKKTIYVLSGKTVLKVKY